MYYEPAPINDFNPYMRHSSCHKKNETNTLRVQGKGNVNASPDTANIVLGVETENTDLKIAQNENAIISTRIINSLKSIGISEKNINTDSYLIQPQYDFVDGRQVFRSYKVTNSMRIVTKAINNVGVIVDTATANGSNIVSTINFSLSDAAPYYRRALNLAVKDAITKARDISNNLGVLLDDIPITVIENNTNYIPGIQGKTLAATAATPIMPGQIEIIATITATFNYSD